MVIAAFVAASGGAGVAAAAVLDGAVAALECRTVSTVDAGDHTVVLGEVLGLDVPAPGGEPLLYYEGRYRSFGSDLT